MQGLSKEHSPVSVRVQWLCTIAEEYVGKILLHFHTFSITSSSPQLDLIFQVKLTYKDFENRFED